MNKLLIIAALLVLGCATASAEMPGGGVSFGAFYSSLDPYGEWISISDGIYAWRPVGEPSDWRPYSYGHWIWTDFGWYWSSDEPWAWAVYHYGRWYDDDYYGWVWIPGYDWAPAWVEWRYGPDCVGWAPLGPYAVFSTSFGIFYRTTWVTPYNYWCFTDYGYMTSAGLHNNIYRTENNTRYIGRTRGGGSVQYDGGRIVSRGPEVRYVERHGNLRVARVYVVDSDRRRPERILRNGEQERIEVYRPSFGQNDVNDAGRPGRVREAERPMRLDVNNLDVRARAQDREAGRDLRRAEQYRNDAEVRRTQIEQPRPPEVQQQRRMDYRQEMERRSVERQRAAQPPRNQVDRAPAPRRESVDRPRQVRPADRAPERRESVNRAPAPAPPRQQSAPSRENGRRRD